MKTILGAVAVAVLISATSGAASANYIFNLSGVTFADGGTLTGSFVTDDSLDTLLSYNLTASPTVGTFPGFTYTPADSTIMYDQLPTFFELTMPGSSDELVLIFGSSGLTPSGASLTGNSGLGDSFELESGGFGRFVVSGTVIGSAVVPEPSSLALCGLSGPAGLGMAWKRRRRVGRR